MKNKKLLLKRIFAIASVVIVLGVMGYVTYMAWQMMEENINTPEAFESYVRSFGVKGYLVALGLQILQVFVALIPGEVVEIGLGYAFGWFTGTLICLLGVTLASSVVFLLVKRLGIKVVELFVDSSKINNLRFLNSEKKLKRTVFLLFFIPGTPKDLLTYFIGLTRINLVQFLGISTVARLPSVLTSTLVGHFAVKENYVLSIIIFACTAIISLLGLLIYNRFIKNKKEVIAEKKERLKSKIADKRSSFRQRKANRKKKRKKRNK